MVAVEVAPAPVPPSTVRSVSLELASVIVRSEVGAGVAVTVAIWPLSPSMMLLGTAIAKTGTVKVTEAFAVERYSHVMHIVSNVEGVLKEGMSSMDVLRATFPAGTLTGAPKVHAMELIDQLEPVKRGIYGGACGYLSFAGDMDVAIAIRTGIIKDETLYVQAAAGVVADSVPEMEWRETEHKARALLRASELVEEGLE